MKPPRVLIESVHEPKPRRLGHQPWKRFTLRMGVICMLGLSSWAQDWTGPWDWSHCIMGPPQFPGINSTCNGALPEISHAALIPAGLYKGKVLFWHQGWKVIQGNQCDFDIAQAWIWDPLTAGDPAQAFVPLQITPFPPGLIQVTDVLNSDIFCSGVSWDTRGELVIAGGNRNVNLSEFYRFRASSLSRPPMSPFSNCDSLQISQPAGFPAWIQTNTTGPVGATPTMFARRFYPTCIALSRHSLGFSSGLPINNGAHLVLGGERIPDTLDPDQTRLNTLWEFLPYGYVVDPTLVPPRAVQGPSVTTGTWTDYYGVFSVGTDPLPSEVFVNYPRAYQMSTGDVLVCDDAGTDNSHNPHVFPEDWWVIRPYGPYQTGGPLFELWTGSLAGSASKTRHNYGTTVLQHRLLTHDRVLVFGGFGTAPSLASDAVEEFVPAATTTNLGGLIVNGSWSARTPMAVPRLYSNAVALPTGTILLTGGTMTIPAVASTNPTVYTNVNPVFEPEIYDPLGSTTIVGVGTTIGSTTLMPPGNVPTYPITPSALYPTARLYHHVALLLPDGSVFIAGGQEMNTGSIASNGEFTGEIFRPAYMTPTNPVKAFIRQVPNIMDQTPVPGTPVQFQLTVGDLDVSTFKVDGVVLTRPASVTHFFDMDQRYVELDIVSTSTVAGDEVLQVKSLPENLGPAGIYMLWVIVKDINTGERIPLHCEFVFFH